MRLDGDKVRWARERLGHTMEMVGDEAGVSKNSVLRAEHEEDIRPVTARRIAQALGVEVADLVKESAVPKVTMPTLSEALEVSEEAGVVEEERHIRRVDPGTLKWALNRLTTFNGRRQQEIDRYSEEGAPRPDADWAHEVQVLEHGLTKEFREQGIIDFVKLVNETPFMTSDEVRRLCVQVDRQLNFMRSLVNEVRLEAQIAQSEIYEKTAKFAHKVDKADPQEALRQEEPEDHHAEVNG